MKKANASQVQAKVIDFKRFAFVLLMVSVFLYLGVLIPSEGKTALQTYGAMGATIVCIGLSGLFFAKTIKYKKILAEMNESDTISK